MTIITTSAGGDVSSQSTPEFSAGLRAGIRNKSHADTLLVGLRQFAQKPNTSSDNPSQLSDSILREHDLVVSPQATFLTDALIHRHEMIAQQLCTSTQKSLRRAEVARLENLLNPHKWVLGTNKMGKEACVHLAFTDGSGVNDKSFAALQKSLGSEALDSITAQDPSKVSKLDLMEQNNSTESCLQTMTLLDKKMGDIDPDSGTGRAARSCLSALGHSLAEKAGDAFLDWIPSYEQRSKKYEFHGLDSISEFVASLTLDEGAEKSRVNLAVLSAKSAAMAFYTSKEHAGARSMLDGSDLLLRKTLSLWSSGTFRDLLSQTLDCLQGLKVSYNKFREKQLRAKAVSSLVRRRMPKLSYGLTWLGGDLFEVKANEYPTEASLLEFVETKRPNIDWSDKAVEAWVENAEDSKLFMLGNHDDSEEGESIPEDTESEGTLRGDEEAPVPEAPVPEAPVRKSWADRVGDNGKEEEDDDDDFWDPNKLSWRVIKPGSSS